MLDILLFILFCIQNGKLATRKGLSSRKWIWITVGAMFGGMFVGSIFVSVGYKGPMDIVNMQKFLFQNPLKIVTMYALEIGGGLLVRYILEKKPDATSQE
jgi:hypothetical protein